MSALPKQRGENLTEEVGDAIGVVRECPALRDLSVTEIVELSDSVSGPVDRVGARYTLWFGKMASPTEVIAVERPRHFRTRFGNRLLRGINDARFEPTDGRTRVEQTFETEGFVSALFARIFATGSYKGSFRGELEAFARLAERTEFDELR